MNGKLCCWTNWEEFFKHVKSKFLLLSLLLNTLLLNKIYFVEIIARQCGNFQEGISKVKEQKILIACLVVEL